jgi:NADH-quinone oxidoreductase subunit F
MIGSGGLVVMDEDTCMVEVPRFFMNFTQNESCGKCVPCREGTKRMLEILERIVRQRGHHGGHGAAGGAGQHHYQHRSVRPGQERLQARSRAPCAISGTSIWPHRGGPPLSHLQLASKLRRIWRSIPSCARAAASARAELPHGTPSPARSSMPHVIDTTKCINCGACVGSLPVRRYRRGGGMTMAKKNL